MGMVKVFRVGMSAPTETEVDKGVTLTEMHGLMNGWVEHIASWRQQNGDRVQVFVDEESLFKCLSVNEAASDWLLAQHEYSGQRRNLRIVGTMVVLSGSACRWR